MEKLMSDKKISCIKITNGVHFIEIKDKNLRILCGCPADSVKHLRKAGIINEITVEKDGKKITYETGPNAILLSDVPIQNGDFSNLSEFPILHMLYLQGMIIPNHPNNTDELPLLIGTKSELSSQLEYIKRGNYGFYNIEELLESGHSPHMAERIMKMKLYFAFGRIRESNELVKPVPFRGRIAKIKDEVYIFRKSLNLFEISYKNQSVIVDLNLRDWETYQAPFDLESMFIERDYFSIVNSGNGDGWNEKRPCTGSVIIFQGRIYLIDSGPNTSYVLRKLGIDIGEVRGVFLTHIHDDHFTGLTTLMTSNHRVKIFAPKDIVYTFFKKLSALTMIEEKEFFEYFDVNYLEYDTTINIEGLEVVASISPHPVETAIYRFKTMSNTGNIKTYSHNVDIISERVLKAMLEKNTESSYKMGIDKEFYDEVMKNYNSYADIKKIDIGGGLIHGEAVDFNSDKDKSGKKLLSHTHRELNETEKQIGIDIPFGHTEVLIKAEQNYLRKLAKEYLEILFPKAKEYQLNVILNCKIKRYSEEEQFINKDSYGTNAFLVITGTVIVIKQNNMQKTIRAGSIVGDLVALETEKGESICKTVTPCNILTIPSQVLKKFLGDAKLRDEFTVNKEKRFFIQSTTVLDDGISTLDQYLIAKSTYFEYYSKNQIIIKEGENCRGLFFVGEGEVEIYKNGHLLEVIKPFSVACEKAFLESIKSQITMKAKTSCKIGRIEDKYILEIPIIRFRLREIEAKRKEKYLFKQFIKA